MAYSSLKISSYLLSIFFRRSKPQDKADRTLLNQSIREAKEALAIDPNSMRALHALAFAHATALSLQIEPDREHALQENMWATSRAIELDRTDAYGYSLRATGVMHREQWDRYPDALADARHAHEMNPNDTNMLRNLDFLEAVAGEPERAVEHFCQVMRLNPRDSHCHITYVGLAMACFSAKQFAEGIGWASRALRDRPLMVPPYLNLVVCLVGAGEIDKAKAMFETLQKVASAEYVGSRLEGMSSHGRPEVRRRMTTFLRIAAGLEDPIAAEALR